MQEQVQIYFPTTFTLSTTCHPPDAQFISDCFVLSACKGLCKKKNKALLLKHAIQIHLLEQSRQFLVLYLH